MPRIDLTDDEYDTILSLREREDKPRGYCEDYPCCGHTPDDPCTRQWYDTAAGKAQIMRHACCDHEAGYCEIEPPEPECDVCYEYECDVPDWCGSCGCCREHCQQFADCPDKEN